MKLRVVIPETIVTLETTSGTLPEGTSVLLQVPLKGLATEPLPQLPDEYKVEETKPVVIEPPVEKPIEIPIEPTKTPEVPIEEKRLHIPTFEKTFDSIEFRASEKRFENLGKAKELGLSEANWTLVLNVRFVNFDNNHRVIGSSTTGVDAGSSLQIGILKGGLLWVDTFKGAMTSEQLELNKWYEIAISHRVDGQETIYVDKKISRLGGVPVFKSDSDIYVGRWVNTYADFDLKRIRIYPLLSTEEIQEI